MKRRFKLNRTTFSFHPNAQSWVREDTGELVDYKTLNSYFKQAREAHIYPEYF